MPPDLIIYALVAAGLAFWLKNILGTREEGDEPKGMPKSLAELEAAVNKEAAAMSVNGTNQKSASDQIERVNKDKSGVIGVENKTAESNLVKIIDADKDFDLKFFMGAAQDVFVMVVEAFAEGDTETLEDMLKPNVYKAFDGVIKERAKTEQIIETEILAIHEARVIEANLDKKFATITLRFVAEEATVIKDKEGSIIEGHPEKGTRMTDIWTFSRDLKSRDPRWFVEETRGDFEGDNELIPNSD